MTSVMSHRCKREKKDRKDCCVATLEGQHHGARWCRYVLVCIILETFIANQPAFIVASPLQFSTSSTVSATRHIGGKEICE